MCAHREVSGKMRANTLVAAFGQWDLEHFLSFILAEPSFYTIIIDLLSLERNNKAILVLEKK